MADQGVWGTEIPSGVQGQSPGGGLGAKSPEAVGNVSYYDSINLVSVHHLLLIGQF